jgi:hypothetical protein
LRHAADAIEEALAARIGVMPRVSRKRRNKAIAPYKDRSRRAQSFYCAGRLFKIASLSHS